MKKINSKNIKYILIMVCGVFVLVLGLFLTYKFSDNGSLLLSFKNSDNEEEEEIVYETHISYDGLFSVEAPSSWIDIEEDSFFEKYDLNEKAVIELTNPDTNSFMILVVNSKVDLDTTFDNYKKDVFEQKEEFYGVEISKYDNVTIDEHDAQYGVLYVTSNATNIYVRAYAIETDNYFGQIVIWTIASNEDEVQDDFDSITTSLKEI